MIKYLNGTLSFYLVQENATPWRILWLTIRYLLETNQNFRYEAFLICVLICSGIFIIIYLPWAFVTRHYKPIDLDSQTVAELKEFLDENGQNLERIIETLQLSYQNLPHLPGVGFKPDELTGTNSTDEFYNDFFIQSSSILNSQFNHGVKA